jgi:hypothetical protein
MNTPRDLLAPYQPPTADLSQPFEQMQTLPPHERSAAPKVFGILSIIFASLVLLSSAFGLLAMAAGSAMGNLGDVAASSSDKGAEITAVMHPLAKIYQGMGVESLILFVMSALLLAIGIGQIRYRAWARRWSVYWGWAALTCVALMVAISLLIISPAYAELFDSAARITPQKGGEAIPDMSGLSAIFGGTFAVLCIIFYTPYPALMLMFFTRERVRASMTD